MSQTQVSDFLDSLRSLISELEGVKVPSIGVVDGYALGGGMEIALGCDLRVGGTSCVFDRYSFHLYSEVGSNEGKGRIMSKKARRWAQERTEVEGRKELMYRPKYNHVITRSQTRYNTRSRRYPTSHPLSRNSESQRINIYWKKIKWGRS